MTYFRITLLPKSEGRYWVLENSTRPVMGGRLLYAGSWNDCVKFLRRLGW